jgi:hypothetical protein
MHQVSCPLHIATSCHTQGIVDGTASDSFSTDHCRPSLVVRLLEEASSGLLASPVPEPAATVSRGRAPCGMVARETSWLVLVVVGYSG